MKKNKLKSSVYEAPRMGEYSVFARSCIASSLNGSTDSYGENSGSWPKNGNEGYQEENGTW